MADKEPPWLIWSFEHDSWWSPDCQDYTENIAEAGRYSFAEALDIVRDANHGQNKPEEAMIPDDH